VEYIEVDGSLGEGGGQVLRYSLALSALTLKPVRVFNIRAKRDNPGLRPQHLAAVKALAEVSGAEVKGASPGSMEVWFKPRRRVHGSLSIDVGTAGSVSLVIQAILPVLLYSPGESAVTVKGGTDVPWSPPVDYMSLVFTHNLKPMGVEASVRLLKRGHYPRGGGAVELRVKPVAKPLKPLSLVKRGRLLKAVVVSHSVRLPRHVAERQASTAASLIERVLGVKPEVVVDAPPPESDTHLGPGSGVLAYVEAEPWVRLGGDALGEKGKPAEKVGEEAFRKLAEDYETGMAFDRHMGDMLIPYLFLAQGVSRTGVARITSHLTTALEISRLFFPGAEARVEGVADGPGVVEVKSPGFQP